MQTVTDSEPVVNTTAPETPTRVKSLGTKVTESTYAGVLQECGEKTPSEWLRELVEWRLNTAPTTVTLLEAVLAIRRLLIQGVIHPVADMKDATKAQALIAETDALVMGKARSLLGLSGER